jgi:hypothetical protein
MKKDCLKNTCPYLLKSKKWRMEKNTDKDHKNFKPHKINVTDKKLANLPFKSAKALKDAQDQIKLTAWRRLEEARVINEMLKSEDYQFWHDEFAKGFVCQYVEDDDSSLVKVFSSENGIHISINKLIANAAPLEETFFTQLVKSISESFAMTYFKAKGILPLEATHKLDESSSSRK